MSQKFGRDNKKPLLTKACELDYISPFNSALHCRNFPQLLHRNLWKAQLLVQPVTKLSPKWYPLFSVYWTCYKEVELYQNTVQCHYNAVNFIPNPHNRLPVARPWGRGMGCQLWVSIVILSSASVIAVPWMILWEHVNGSKLNAMYGFSPSWPECQLRTGSPII